MHLIGARAIDDNMTICHGIYLCSGTLGKQAIIERIVCMLPKDQPKTIIFTNVPKKMKNCKTTLAFITLTTSSCQLPCFVIYLSFDQLFVVITFLGQSGSFGGCQAAKGEKGVIASFLFRKQIPKKVHQRNVRKRFWSLEAGRLPWEVKEWLWVSSPFSSSWWGW